MDLHALDDSEIASSLLKVGEIYPDSSGGSDQITYTYNRQQQVLVVTDQGATEHTYAYDALGRVTQDRATALGSGVDGTVRRIGRTYDARGMVESVSSYDNPAVGLGSVPSWSVLRAARPADRLDVAAIDGEVIHRVWRESRTRAILPAGNLTMDHALAELFTVTR